MIYVIQLCNGDQVDEQTIQVENIEEDFQGRDLLTFRCNSCGELHKSFRIGLWTETCPRPTKIR